MSSLLSVLCCSIIYGTHASNFTTSGTYVTLMHDLYKIIEDTFLPPDYVLPMNLYEWNVSEILYYINEFDPEYLYIVPTTSLVAIFPDIFLKQLPRDVLTTHGLYHLLPVNDTLAKNATTNFTIEAPSTGCQYPFVDTKHDSYFKFEFEELDASFDCGLLCEYGDVMFGIRPDDQAIVDVFLCYSAFIFLFMIVLVFINQCMDFRCNQNEDPCCKRGFMFHAPICLACFYALMAICLTLPNIIGKEAIVCADDLDDNLTVSMSNPGGSLRCTIVGLLFHTSFSLVGLYTFGFTFVLWRQFFAPLQSLWSTISRHPICCMCLCCVDKVLKPLRDCINARQRYVNAVTHLQKSTSAASVSRSVSPHASPRFRHNNKDVTCFDIFCGATTWTHYILFAIAIMITALAAVEDVIDGFTPLGICTAGGKEKRTIWLYSVMPLTFCLSGCTFFLPYAIYLLFQVSKYSTNKATKKMMRGLGVRILIYFICIELALFIIWYTPLMFYLERDSIMKAAEERMFCLTYRATTGDVSKCYHGFSLSIHIYILLALSMPLAGLSSLGLSCHWKNRKRWFILVQTVFDCICCKGYQHEEPLCLRLRVKEVKPGMESKSPSSRSSDENTSKTPKAFGFPSGTDFTPTQKKRYALDVPSRDALPAISRLDNAQTVSTTMEMGTMPTMSSQKVGMPSSSSFEIVQETNANSDDANQEQEEDEKQETDDEEVP